MSKPLRVVMRPLADLRPSPRNPRRHSDEQIVKIAQSIRKFGFNNPILVDQASEIIAGEARWRAAKVLGRIDAPTITLAHLTAVERDAYRIADNRLPLDAVWDEELLAEVLRDIAAAELDLSAVGFDEAELAALLDPPAPPHDAAADQAAAPPAEPLTRLGDVWQLGRHRLICGDATRPETLQRLFASERPARLVVTAPPGPEDETADLILTDPPYGMEYEGGRARADLVVTDPPYGMSFGAGKEAGSTPIGAKVKAHGMILGDDARGAALVALVQGALANAKAFARTGAAVYVCLTWRTWAEFSQAMAGAGLGIAACIVWDKGSIGLGYQHYRGQHEFIFYSRGDAWFGGNAEGDVWTVSRGATGEYVHPTQKPVALLERAIRNSSRPGDIVLDVFGGSGSTLIACERLGRLARLVELDPKFCDAIVRRWETFTGGRAVKV